MADGGYQHGQMDTRQQELTFNGFIKLSKWGSLYIAAMLVLLTIWFCTNGGFFGGLIAAVIVVVIGTLVLRERKGPLTH